MNLRERWNNLPEHLKEVICLQRAASGQDARELISMGLAYYKFNGTLSYTERGYDVRFFGFQQNRRGN